MSIVLNETKHFLQKSSAKSAVPNDIIAKRRQCFTSAAADCVVAEAVVFATVRLTAAMLIKSSAAIKILITLIFNVLHLLYGSFFLK